MSVPIIILVKAKIYLKPTKDGGRRSGIKTGYRPNHVFEYDDKGDFIATHMGEIRFDHKEWIQPGESDVVMVAFIHNPTIEKYLVTGRHWWIHEADRKLGEGEILEIL